MRCIFLFNTKTSAIIDQSSVSLKKVSSFIFLFEKKNETPSHKDSLVSENSVTEYHFIIYFEA